MLRMGRLAVTSMVDAFRRAIWSSRPSCRKPGTCLAKSTISWTEMIASSVKWAKRCWRASRDWGSAPRGQGWDRGWGEQSYSRTPPKNLRPWGHLEAKLAPWEALLSKPLPSGASFPSHARPITPQGCGRGSTVTLGWSEKERLLHCSWAATNCWIISS